MGKKSETEKTKIRPEDRFTTLSSGFFICLILGLIFGHGGSQNDWIFSSWQIIWIVIFALNGAVLGWFVRDYSNQNEKFKNISFLSLLFLVGILFVSLGIQDIRAKETYTRYSLIQGREAVYLGIMKIVFGLIPILIDVFIIILWIMAYFTGKPPEIQGNSVDPS